MRNLKKQANRVRNIAYLEKANFMKNKLYHRILETLSEGETND